MTGNFQQVCNSVFTVLLYSASSVDKQTFGLSLKLPDVLELQELSLNLLSKLVLSLILEKHLVVLENLLASLKILE